MTKAKKKYKQAKKSSKKLAGEVKLLATKVEELPKVDSEPLLTDDLKVASSDLGDLKYSLDKDVESKLEAELAKEKELVEKSTDVKPALSASQAYRKYHLEETAKMKGDLRASKRKEINSTRATLKSMNKNNARNLPDIDALELLLVTSKEDIVKNSGKLKALSKVKMNDDYKEAIEMLYLQKVRAMCKHILLFQESDHKINIQEVQWAIKNEIFSLMQIYKKNPKPFVRMTKESYCNAVVWSNRYLLENLYTTDLSLEYLKQDCYNRAEAMYLKSYTPNAINCEKASIELMDYLADRYRWSLMVVRG